jgi:thiamine kinase-like enzyme
MFDETLKSSFLNEQIEKTKDNLKVMMFQPPKSSELDDNIVERAKAIEI